MAIQTTIIMILIRTMTKGDRIPKKQTLKVVTVTMRMETNDVAVSYTIVSKKPKKDRKERGLQNKMFQASFDVLA